jgi:hypothetical protein
MERLLPSVASYFVIAPQPVSASLNHECRRLLALLAGNLDDHYCVQVEPAEVPPGIVFVRRCIAIDDC